MGKKLMLAVAMLALVAAPAFASVQNVKVGGSLKTTSVIRDNFDLSAAPGLNKGSNAILSQTGLNVSADLTDNVSTMIGLTDERLWGTDNTGSNVKVDTAYVTMKELLYSPLTVTVGRQPLAYGNQFLIGDGDGVDGVAGYTDLTGGVNFDAVKAVLAYDPLTVDLFAAKIDEGVAPTSIADDNDDTDLYGINVGYKLGDSMNTVVEAYTFMKNNKSIVSNPLQHKKLYVPGLRLSTNPMEGLNVQLEAAYQMGTSDNVTGERDVDALGAQASVSYALPVLKDMKPVLSAGYTYLSGDEDTTNSTASKAFDPLYENQNDGRIFDALFYASNMKIASVAVEVTPIQDVTAKLSFYNLSQAVKAAPKKSDATNYTNVGSNTKDLGNEIDLDLTYAYTEDVKFGVSAGVFMPGKKFNGASKDNASQVLSSVSVLF